MTTSNDPKLPRIFAFGDPHLPEGVQVRKFQYAPDYFERLRAHLQRADPEVLLIAGDLTWRGSLRHAWEELDKLMALPGRTKYFIEGNHDRWFDDLGNDYPSRQARAQEIFSTRDFYYIGGRADVFTLADGTVVGICGAMGYLLDQKQYSQDEYVMDVLQKESLARALDTLQEKVAETPTAYNLCLLHYPPTHRVITGEKEQYYDNLSLLRNARLIRTVVYGHMHEIDVTLKVEIGSITLCCVSVEKLGYSAMRIF